MDRRLIAALASCLLLPANAFAQDAGDRRARDRNPDRIERRDDDRRRPDVDRQSRIDRAERSIRERRQQRGREEAAPGEDGEGMIYRRSNSYRRW